MGLRGANKHLTGVAALSLAGSLFAACTSEPTNDAEIVPTTQTVPRTSFVILTVPPTTSVAFDEIESCVEQTMYYAFIGDPFWKEAWLAIDQDENTLRDQCTELATADPQTLRNLHDDWLALERELASSQTTTTTEAVTVLEVPVAPTSTTVG